MVVVGGHAAKALRIICGYLELCESAIADSTQRRLEIYMYQSSDFLQSRPDFRRRGGCSSR